MSKFLGPVHFWLYRKIQFQESLIDALISYAVQEGWNDEDLTRYSCQDRRQLDEIIDETNIHGWLQARIQDAEKRYAALVLHLVGSDETLLLLVPPRTCRHPLRLKPSTVSTISCWTACRAIRSTAFPKAAMMP